MATTEAAINALHLAIAGVWAGGVAFVTVGVLPAARDGRIDPEPLGSIVGRLTTLSRASSLLLLLTGGHLAWVRYLPDRLFDSGEGHLVVSMVVLWLALTALVEVAGSRVRDGVDEKKVREPARSGLRLYAIASIVGILLLLIGGVLA